MEYAPLIRVEDDVPNKSHVNHHKANIGQGFDPHKHEGENYQHTITCTVGSLKLTVDGVDTNITPESGAFTFLHGTLHSVEVMADNTEFFTVHPWGEGYQPSVEVTTTPEVTNGN
jgi:hypothetical protein